jgi:hypothetical protein
MRRMRCDDNESITVDAKRQKQQETDTIEQIPQDVIGYIFEFLCLKDVMNFGFTNKLLSQFLEKDSPIWKGIASYYCTSILVDTSEYKSRIKEESLLRFDTTCLDPVILANRNVILSNNNRTCKNNSRWFSIKTRKKIEDGSLYSWDCILDTFESGVGNNAYKVFVGLENDDFPFLSQNYSTDIIGYKKQFCGYSYNCGISEVNVPDEKYGTEKYHAFNSGSIIRCIVDTTAPKYSLDNATFSLYEIQENSDPILITNLEGLDLETNGSFYPAVSIYQPNQVTIRLNNLVSN